MYDGNISSIRSGAGGRLWRTLVGVAASLLSRAGFRQIRRQTEGYGAPGEVRTWWPHPPLRGGFAAWRQRTRGRRLPACLDERMLRDIGIDRDMTERDSTVSFWRLR
jgi:uncharacterized protein YjiS (DUF1127 family)